MTRNNKKSSVRPFLLRNCIPTSCARPGSSLVVLQQNYLNALRTVPTFVSAHTFCTSCKAWLKCHVHAGVDIDAINYTTKYMAKRKQNFPTGTKSSLMNPYLNQEH